MDHITYVLKDQVRFSSISLLKDQLAIFDSVGLVRYAIRHGLVEEF